MNLRKARRDFEQILVFIVKRKKKLREKSYSADVIRTQNEFQVGAQRSKFSRLFQEKIQVLLPLDSSIC